MISDMAIEVKSWRWQPNHQTWYCSSTRVIEPGEVLQFYSRGFACVCGEILKDGDRCLVDPETDRTLPIHINCRHLYRRGM